jgi:hypothetical protein
MYKNTILNTAISTTLSLPRYTLWSAGAVAIAISLDTGLSLVGDGLGVTMGTPNVYAVPGDFVNDNGVSVFAAAGVLVAGQRPDAGSATVYGVTAGTTNINRVDGGNALIATPETEATNAEDPIVYATEVFASGTPVIPSGTDDYQVVKYTISGDIIKNFKVTFALTGASFSGSTYLAVGNSSTATGSPCVGTGVSGSAGVYTVTVDTDASALTNSCSINDGTELYLAFKMASASLKNAGDEVTMKASFVGVLNVNEIPNPTREVTVAKAAKGANVTITSEAGGQVYISAASGAKEFVSKDDSTFQGDTAYISGDEVQIGYVKIVSAAQATDQTGEALFTLGNTNATDATKSDNATLTITSGQFAASPGGVGAVGKVYIDAGTAIEAAFPLADAQTATWSLNKDQLKSIATLDTTVYPNGAPIKIKINGSDAVNVEDADPSAEMIVKLDSLTPSSTITVPITTLRRIPLDGRVCWVYNVPSPGDGVADLLSVRITNDSKYDGMVTGTLYPEIGGEPDFTAVNLLSMIAADAADPRSQVLSLDGTDVVLKAGNTIRLAAEDIAKAGGLTDWLGERKVLKIQSEISDLEVMTLLRYAVDSAKQPQSNVSTGVTGSSCIPKK